MVTSNRDFKEGFPNGLALSPDEKHLYVTIGRKFEEVKLFRGLNATIAFHQFDSAAGDVEYGTEWDASLGFRLGKASMLLKYADYDSKDFGTDTRKLWLQAEWAF